MIDKFMVTVCGCNYYPVVFFLSAPDVILLRSTMLACVFVARFYSAAALLPVGRISWRCVLFHSTNIIQKMLLRIVVISSGSHAFYYSDTDRLWLLPCSFYRNVFPEWFLLQQSVLKIHLCICAYSSERLSNSILYTLPVCGCCLLWKDTSPYNLPSYECLLLLWLGCLAGSHLRLWLCML